MTTGLPAVREVGHRAAEAAHALAALRRDVEVLVSTVDAVAGGTASGLDKAARGRLVTALAGLDRMHTHLLSIVAASR